jgi:hypothetical protein
MSEMELRHAVAVIGVVVLAVLGVVLISNLMKTKHDT